MILQELYDRTDGITGYISETMRLGMDNTNNFLFFNF